MAQKDAYKRAREWIDGAIAMIKPGVRSDHVAECWPKAEEIGFHGEMEAFGLEFAHGLGLGLHERPIISRLNSFDRADGDQGRHGLRAGDLLPGDRRHLGGAHRGRGHRHRQGLPR